jgi:hypothetical protein
LLVFKSKEHPKQHLLKKHHGSCGCGCDNVLDAAFLEGGDSKQTEGHRNSSHTSSAFGHLPQVKDERFRF